ncbi:MAG: hypothetical protein Q9191_007262 [Dirinaria sp. TL-2023a]
MLDHRHEPALLRNELEENVYEYGDINGHNIVLACLAPGQPGKLSAQRLVRPLKQSFPNMRLHLFVGIGGGVPRRDPPRDSELDIHLGDVVVGHAEQTNVPSIIQYNRVSTLSHELYSAPGSLEQSSRQLLQALSPIIADRQLGNTQYDRHLARFKGLPAFEHPGLEKDVLFENTYLHKQPGSDTCKECDTSRYVKRAARETKKIVFHQGTILSDDWVMKNAVKRDKLSKRYHDAICFEMEAAGVMEDTHCLVIRGIADYADSHKNHIWQKYAAATAAAFAREILHKIQPGSRFVEDGRLTEGSIYSFSSANPDSQSRQPLTIRDSSANPNFRQGMTTGFSHQYDNAEQLFEDWQKHKPVLQSLRRVLEAFQAALQILLDSDNENPESRFRVHFRLAQVEQIMTYFEAKLPQEKERHVDQALEHVEAATSQTRKMKNAARLLDQIRFEECCIHGRKIEMKAAADPGERPAAAEVDTAMQNLKTAMRRFEESNRDRFRSQNREYGSWVLNRLEQVKRLLL